jgi:hypothetical protein
MKYTSTITGVRMDIIAHEKLWAWTRMAKGEVSMLGLVEEDDKGPVITDLFLVKQTCTQSSTDMNQEDVAHLLFELGSAGIEGQLRAWVHSHGDMDAFWSAIDENCIQGLAADPYLVSLVVNRKGMVKARIDVFHPIRIIIDDLPVSLRIPDLGLEENCREEFLAKVIEVRPLPMGTSLLSGMPCNGQEDMFGGGFRRHFGRLDPDDLEAAVYRGELTVDEYLQLVDGDFLDPFGDPGCPGEGFHERHA